MTWFDDLDEIVIGSTRLTDKTLRRGKNKVRSNESGVIERICHICKEWKNQQAEFYSIKPLKTGNGLWKRNYQSACKDCQKKNNK